MSANVVTRVAKLAYFGDASNWVSVVGTILEAEYQIGWTSSAILVGDSREYLLAEDVFEVIAPPSHGSLAIALVPSRLFTPFGKAIAGEARGAMIVLSTFHTDEHKCARLLRHELGHYFGLSEHLECAMSPYYSACPFYCPSCVAALARAGVNWRPKDS